MDIAYETHRPWLNTTPSGRLLPRRTYKIVSYNILSQNQLIKQEAWYSQIDRQLLVWNNRFKNIIHELQILKPDILCLQEVHGCHLPQIVARLKITGRQFEYIYQKRRHNRSDGCAILYDMQQFQLIESRPLSQRVSKFNAKDRDFYTLMAKLRQRYEPHYDVQPLQCCELIVANTHLLQFAPDQPAAHRDLVKNLLKSMDGFCYDNATQQRNPILLTGDFNFDCESEPYSILTARTGSFSQPLQMLPIYNDANRASTRIEGLGWTQADHMFYSRGNQKFNLDISKYYMLPRISLCQRLVGPPNFLLGSDHLSLAANFSLYRNLTK